MASNERTTAEGFRAIVTSSLDAIYSYTDRGEITSWNPGAESLLGYTGHQAIGQPVEMLTPAGAHAGAATVHRRVLSGEEVAHFETELRGRDGRLVEVSLTTSRIVDHRGRPVGVSVIARDIAERRALERERDALQRHLELLNAELERSNADLEQFAYVASHDLSEPLRVIAGMVQLLERECQGTLSAQADDYIQRTVAATVRMRRLIDDLLSYARVGREAVEMTDVDCREVAEAACVALGEAIAESQAEITIETLPTVRGDATLLAQLFQNLIGNALKFRQEDPPRITVAARAEGNDWVFSVIDNGIGIPAMHAERVFKVFKRLHARERYPGTGIGLAICQRIVERHGGRIWVEACAGGGTSMCFQLPRGRGT